MSGTGGLKKAEEVCVILGDSCAAVGGPASAIFHSLLWHYMLRRSWLHRWPTRKQARMAKLAHLLDNNKLLLSHRTNDSCCSGRVVFFKRE